MSQLRRVQQRILRLPQPQFIQRPRPPSYPYGYLVRTLTPQKAAKYRRPPRHDPSAVLSPGTVLATVPSLIGDTVAQCTAILTPLSLVLVQAPGQFSTAAPGTVIAQTPAAGTSVNLGSSVIVVLSLGFALVPNLIGLPAVPNATTVLFALGLGSAIVIQPGPPPLGVVLAQSIPPGTLLLGPTTITLFVSDGTLGPTTRVQATAIGQANELLYGPGDVFDVPSVDFASSSIDYSGGAAGGPLFGWMTQVAPTTPLSKSNAPVYDFSTKRRTVY